MSSRTWVMILLLLQCLTLPAQSRRRQVTEPVDAKRAAPPDRSAVLRLLEDAAARLRASPPLFFCSPLIAAAPHSRHNLTIDFRPNRQESAGKDWDRFESDSMYRDFVETLETQQHFDLSVALTDALSLSAEQFTVDHWVGMRTGTGNRATRFAVVNYYEADREATIYVSPDTGVIGRIILRGFPTAGLATPQHCSAE